MSLRVERLSSQLQNDLGSIIQEYQNDNIITVTNVRVSPDLSNAKVYVSIYSEGGDHEEVFKYLNEHNSEIRGKLARKIRNHVKRIPELVFYMDDSAEYANRMEQLFEKIRKERNNESD